MKLTEAMIVYFQSELMPHLVGDSEIGSALLNGAMRVGRKRIADKIGNFELLRAFGITDEEGNADLDMVREFMDGVFDNREKVRVSLAEVLKLLIGVESESPLLADKLTFTKNDAEKFIELLMQ